LKDAAAWLSTLGGGFSALGEHSSQHVSCHHAVYCL